MLHFSHMDAFWTWWQGLPSVISPYIASAGPVRLHWYGFMYVVAFAVGYLLVRARIRRGEIMLEEKQLQDLLFWLVIGVVLGGRLGYAVFYAPEYFLSRPLEIFLPFSLLGGTARLVGIAGMSFHGGLIGIIAAAFLFARSRGIGAWRLMNELVPAAPAAFFFGRVGNFLNGELWGRPTEMPWGMVFPRSGDALLRHPSQLYEAALEGLLIFAVLWPLRNAAWARDRLLGLYLVLYGLARFLVELVREPDAHLGAVLGPLTMGQTLSTLTLAGGIVLLLCSARIARKR